jgi:hypothetical protein
MSYNDTTRFLRSPSSPLDADRIGPDGLEMEDYNGEPIGKLYDKDIEKLNRRTVRKLDLLLLPFLALLFLFNSLDRSNVGNAEARLYCLECVY